MKVYIPTPPGIQLPSEDGEEFNVTAKVKSEGGKLCVISLNGIPVSGEKAGDSEDDKESDNDADEMMSKMTPSQAAMKAGY